MGIDLGAMVHLDDLDVPVGVEPQRRLAHQVEQHRHAERGVARLEHRDLFGCRIAKPVVAFFEAGGADHNGNSRRDGRIEVGLKRRGAGEIDQHVADLCQRQRIAALIDSARQGLTRSGNRR